MASLSLSRALTLFALVGAILLGLTPCLLPGQEAQENIEGTTAGQPSEEAEDIPELQEAAKRFDSGDFTGAKALLDEAVEKHPELPPAALIMVQFFARMNQQAGVYNWLQQAVLEAPEDPEAYLVLADLNFQDRRWAEAAALYEEARERLEDFDRDPDRKAELTNRALLGMAGVAEVRGDLAEAQRNLEKVLEASPQHARALQQLAHTLFKQEKPEEALERLRAAAEVEDDLLPPEAILAQFYEQQGDQAKANEWMSAAITANPRDYSTRMAAAQWALRTGQVKTAEQQADAALVLQPDSVDAQVLRGVIALFQKDFKEATEYLQKAYLQAPSNFAASNYLALALAASDDPQQRRRAFEFAENNVRKHPDNPEAYSTLGWTLVRTGRLNDAEQAFSTAVSRGPLRADAAYYWARLKLERGRTDEARQLVENALASRAPFMMRTEAEDLLEQLQKRQ